MTTPDTEQQELEDQLRETIEATLLEYLAPASVAEPILEAIADPITAITRRAVAYALEEQGRSLAKLGGFMRQQASSHVRSGREQTAITYDAMADTYYGSANKLTKAAADKLAEGYEYECAAFSQECDQRVPDAGDFCSKHEPEDDEDRWAE